MKTHFHFFLKSLFLGLQDNKIFPTSKKKRLSCKIAVVVDEKIMSFTETFCMLIKAYCPDAIFIGKQTVGSNGDYTDINLNGFEASMTSIDFEYPDGTKFQKNGIIPDYAIKIPLSIKIQSSQAKFTYIRDRAIEICKKLIKNGK